MYTIVWPITEETTEEYEAYEVLPATCIDAIRYLFDQGYAGQSFTEEQLQNTYYMYVW